MPCTAAWVGIQSGLDRVGMTMLVASDYSWTVLYVWVEMSQVLRVETVMVVMVMMVVMVVPGITEGKW